jgi:hypothetical protein
MKPRFIGLSTGRAGSRYLTALLNDAGVPTSHETGIWDCESLSKFMAGDGDVLGEVSAHYVTQIKSHLPVDFRIWHFSRHPQPFVSSMLKFGFWDLDTPNIHPFLRKTGDPLSDSYRYWVDWNQRILDITGRNARTMFRIEDVDRDLIDMLTFRIGIDADTSKINPCWEEKQEFAEIPSEVEAEVTGMMEVLGYAVA